MNTSVMWYREKKFREIIGNRCVSHWGTLGCVISKLHVTPSWCPTGSECLSKPNTCAVISSCPCIHKKWWCDFIHWHLILQSITFMRNEILSFSPSNWQHVFYIFYTNDTSKERCIAFINVKRNISHVISWLNIASLHQKLWFSTIKYCCQFKDYHSFCILKIPVRRL